MRRRERPTDSEIATTMKIEALTSEMHAIHFANGLYWERREEVTLEARAEYQRRKDRLEQIRSELAQLQSS